MRLFVVATTVLLIVVGSAEARGRCDGFHGCRCGMTQARYFGLPRFFRKFNLALAHDWTRAFPHVSSPSPGIVVFQWRRGGGHVSRVVQNTGKCRAIVSDDRGQYERNICRNGAQYVEVTTMLSASSFKNQRDMVP